MNIEDCLTQAATVAKEENNILSNNIHDLKTKLDGKSFQLVVLGQFKRGKTSLINALFGVNLPPSAIID